MKAGSDLASGRHAYRARKWLSAHDHLSRADRVEPLAADDLELLAKSAYMLGRDDDYVAALERAHHVHVENGAIPSAVRCAFWVGHNFLFRGEKARAAGWFARAERLLERVEHESVERGYLQIPVWLDQMGRGDFESGYATAAEAAAIAERFGDADLMWLARDEQARALMRLGRTDEALRLLDEALVAATAGELSPIVTGIVYCNTISFCHARCEVRRVREWTNALTRWCEGQSDMIAHNGLCLVHRAQIMLMAGEWEKALSEARRSAERFTQGVLNQIACGEAFYCQGEAFRLRGDFEAAEHAYRQASQHRREPQPGLSLIRLAQNKADAAASAIRRVIGETTMPLARARVLPAYVEIMLAIGSLELARAASRELEEIARSIPGCELLAAMAAQTQGVVTLAEGQPADALLALRRALDSWSDLSAPYEAARIRVSIGMACSALGDEDTARLEFDAAKRIFEELGATPDVARLDELHPPAVPGRAHGLTARELEVLRRLAAGKSNRAIAAELFISEHTVARHVQNIFSKLDVSSRTAATAFAFAHNLI